VSVVIIAEKAFHDQYLSINLKGEKVYKCSPVESKDAVNRYRADIIILDCGLEVGNGLQLLKELKSSQSGTPIIFITDVGSEDILLKAFKTGARDFFKKPVHMLELMETVKGILSVKKATREKRRSFTRSVSSQEEFFRKLTTSQPNNIIRAIHYIEENLSGVINLERLAQESTVSKYHFCRLFKRCIGMSPMKFVISMRIMRAKKLLKIYESSVSSVATNVGFNDLSSFIVQFKKFTGMTPVQYKKSLREEL